MIFTIASREFRQLFLSPLAWVVLAVVQVILSWILFVQIDQFFLLQDQLATLPNAPGVTDLVIAPTIEFASIVLLMVTPLITMRLFSDELRSGTLKLLLSSPVSATEIVLGKFAGAVAFMFVFTCMIALMPLALNIGTEVDMGKLASALLGLMLLLTAFTAAGVFVSSLTSNPVIAAMGTFGILLLFWLLDTGSAGDAAGDNHLAYLSLLKHFTPLLRGIVDTRDIAFFLLFIGGFIILTIRQLDARRLQG